jgi:methanogenic corrinoid protein MtbC1
LIKEKLNGMKSWLPDNVLDEHLSLRPDMAKVYKEHQKTHFKNDVAWILSFLGESVWAGQPALFEEFSSWLKTFLTSLKVPMQDVAESYNLIGQQLSSALDPAEVNLVIGYLNQGKYQLFDYEENLSIPAAENSLHPVASAYLEFLLKGNRYDALELILSETRQGMTVRDVYIQVFQPVLHEIGRLWQINRITVAQEHFCTAATQMVMSQLYPLLFTGERKLKKMAATCVPGELHEMGARMVTDFFEMEGWDTYYLGANMPVEGVVRFIGEIQPKVLAVSATMTFHLSSAEEMIRRVRQSSSTPPDLKILVGGYPFKVAKGLRMQVGADGFAGSAPDAVEIAEKLIAS